uniref:Putative secreted protein n=1 Tax=Ixodes ricinus TaxID=34613 RepID=A0A6B0UEZ1_IXORI
MKIFLLSLTLGVVLHFPPSNQSLLCFPCFFLCRSKESRIQFYLVSWLEASVSFGHVPKSGCSWRNSVRSVGRSVITPHAPRRKARWKSSFSFSTHR